MSSIVNAKRDMKRTRRSLTIFTNLLQVRPIRWTETRLNGLSVFCFQNECNKKWANSKQHKARPYWEQHTDKKHKARPYWEQKKLHLRRHTLAYVATNHILCLPHVFNTVGKTARLLG